MRNWDFENNPTIDLNGEWEFYWQQLLTEQNFLPDQSGSARLTGMMQIPSFWNDYEVDGKKLGGKGFATFRLKLLLPKNLPPLKLRCPYVGTAYKLFSNEGLLSSNGKVGRTLSETRGESRVIYTSLSFQSEQQLVVQIANFQNARGGFWYSMVLGTFDNIGELELMNLWWEGFLSDVIIMMGLYHLVLFAFRKQDRTTLWFALICLVVAFRMQITGETVVQNMLPGIPYESIKRLEYLGYYIAIPLFALFLKNLFPEDVSNFAVRFILGIGGLFSLLVIFLSPYYFSHTLRMYQVFSIFAILIFFYSMVLSILHRRYNAKFFLFGCMILFSVGVHDIFHNTFLLPTPVLSPVGLFLFAFVQSAVLARRFNRAYEQITDLSENLEKKVKLRTLELEQAKAETEKLNDFARIVHSTTNLDTVIDSIFSYVRDVYEIDSAILWLPEQKNQKLISKYQMMDKAPVLVQEYSSRIEIALVDSNFITQIYYRGKPFYIANVHHPLFKNKQGIHNLFSNLQVISVLFIPLVVQNKSIAMFAFTSSQSVMVLRKEKIASLSRFCEQVAGAVDSSSLLRQVQMEREKSDRLLLNILPIPTSQELKEKGQVTPKYYDSVSVVFTDFVGFTKVSEEMTPKELVDELDGCFSQFDEATKRYGMEKLKTIGDAYMCAGGLPQKNTSHAIDACLTALEFLAFINQITTIKKSMHDDYWQIRIGIHTGPVTAGVIGVSKFSYDIWGDTVNTASRMESSGIANRINISGSTYEHVQDFFVCEYRGKVEAKGKGKVDMYFLQAIKAEYSVRGEGILPNDKLKKEIGLFS
ncbi:MAG: adenylate/guanylate cyclase domain-containing protein [Spirochaetota bacterium]